MKAVLLAPLLAACIGGPDRWFASVSRGDGSIGGVKGLDLPTEETRLEVGISGPLGAAAKHHHSREAHPVAIGAPVGGPAAGGLDIPWTELLFLLGGAAGLEGGRRGYQRVRRYRSKCKEPSA